MDYLHAFNNGEQSKLFRDKLAKTSQYLSKIIAEISKDEQTKKWFSLLASQISVARRVYRWGQVTNSIESIIKHLSSNSHKSLFLFFKKLFLNLAYFLSQTFDMIAYIYIIRGNKSKTEFCGYWCQFFYFVMCAIEFIDSFIPMISALHQITVGDDSDHNKKQLWIQANNGFLNSTRRVGDGITALKDVLPEVFEPYLFGVYVAGFTSGVVSIYQSVPSLFN
eukprot:TRINITY_DN1485_c0_g1_i1.p1 TRINITY_DN1485_c0_g1~~TRINITY_DN1485_c0_g1_i1.p1  ORF type:complete len:222 (-),score=37.50 TRINITY_DN1485_c0_g1_i1:174-839(-)